MNVFVWDRAVCGPRISCYASVDCSGGIRKLHVTKIGMHQDFVTLWNAYLFWQMAVRRGQLDPSRAKSQCWRTRLKVHMARRTCLNSSIIQTQENTSVSGRIAGNIRMKLHVCFRWFVINISGLTSPFVLTSCGFPFRPQRQGAFGGAHGNFQPSG